MAYGVGLLAAGTLVGGVLAGTVSASAATTASPSTSSGTSSSAGTAPSGTAPAAPKGHGGATPVRSDEKSVSATTLATLKAAALKAVPGGTVYRVETDAGDGAYEAHMTKADGSAVTVKFDKALAVIKVEQGMGQGDPAGHGPAGDAQPGNGPAQGAGGAGSA
jgi:hypothetical protein